jgi:hypothetical protein
MATSSRTRRPIWDRASTGLRQDLLHSLRALKKTPGLTIAVLITLAIGIGVNAAIFSIIDAVMLRPLPYPRGDRIVTIWEKKPNGQPNSMTTLNYLDYAKQSTLVTDPRSLAAARAVRAPFPAGPAPPPRAAESL